MSSYQAKIIKGLGRWFNDKLNLVSVGMVWTHLRVTALTAGTQVLVGPGIFAGVNIQKVGSANSVITIRDSSNGVDGTIITQLTNATLHSWGFSLELLHGLHIKVEGDTAPEFLVAYRAKP